MSPFPQPVQEDIITAQDLFGSQGPASMPPHQSMQPNLNPWPGSSWPSENAQWFNQSNDSAMTPSHSMAHPASAPALNMPNGLHSPSPSASPAVMRSPIHSHSLSAPWPSNNSTQSPASEACNLEERLNDIINQSNAAMATPVNLHTLSGDISMDSNTNMDSTIDSRPGMTNGRTNPPSETQSKPDGEETSRVLAIAEHCPAQLRRPHWSMKQFNIMGLLYMGNNSQVVKAVDTISGMPVALKVYNKHKLSDMEKYQVAREIRMHSELLHNNIVRLYCAWKDSRFIHVAEEYAPHGDIYSLLKPRNGMRPVGVAEPFVVTRIFRPLLSALSFIHARGLIHRDLKPENILLGENHEIKLTDFGLSINVELEIANTRLGTLNYIAPEILKCPYKHHPLENKDSDTFGYDNKVDVWSLGVLAYELLTAELPFNGSCMRVTLEKIMRNQVLYPNYVSPVARDFVTRCLQSNPQARPSVDELSQHPWITNRYEGDM